MPHKMLLCVGGPLAGKRVRAPTETGFREQGEQYRVELFPVEDLVALWVPKDQTTLQTLEQLAEGYERSMAQASE